MYFPIAINGKLATKADRAICNIEPRANYISYQEQFDFMRREVYCAEVREPQPHYIKGRKGGRTRLLCKDFMVSFSLLVVTWKYGRLSRRYTYAWMCEGLNLTS